MQRSSRGSEAGGTSVITGAPTPGVPRRALPRTIESFKSPTYRLFFGSMMCQMGAMNMQMLARSWLMYELTNSPAWLGFASLAVGLPALCFSFLGGMIADRVQKKHVLIVGQTAFSLISLLLALSITLDIISIERQTGALLLLVSAVAQGTVDAFMNPARQAMIPEIVGRRSLSNAIALNAAGMNVNRLLLPAGAGFLIVLVGVEAVFYLMAFLYLAASLLVLPLPLSATPPLRGESPFTNFVAGLRYIKGSTMLPGLLLLTLVAVLFSMPYQNLLPVFTKDILGVGPGGLGMLVTVSGLGALVGSIVIASSDTRRRGLLYLFSILGTGIALLGFSASHWYPVSLAIVIGVGLGQAGRMSLSNILIQESTDDAYRGRVMGVYNMEWGLTSLSSFGVALLAGFIGVQWAIGGMAALLLVAALYYLAFVPSIRRLS